MATRITQNLHGLRLLLAQGEITAVFVQLKEDPSLPKELRDRIAVVESNFSSANNQRRQGIITNEDFDVRQAKAVAALLELFRQWEEGTFKTAGPVQPNNRRWLWVSIPFFLLLLSGIILSGLFERPSVTNNNSNQTSGPQSPIINGSDTVNINYTNTYRDTISY